MARQVAIPTTPQFPQVAKLNASLEVAKKELRAESLVLRNSADEDRDYNHFIYVGSKELAVIDSLRFLRNLAGRSSAEDILSEFQTRINDEVELAVTRKTLLNDYEKMLGKGAQEGYAIVQEKLDALWTPELKKEHQEIEAA
jgi:hypothetical protein